MNNSTEIDFDRDVYKEYEDWLKYSKDKVLYVYGPRQVGKTYSIDKFCKRHFNNIYSLNLFDDAILNKLNSLLESFTLPNAIKEIFPNFIDSEDSVVYIDEIQESSKVFNGIRSFLKSYKCRLIVSGSFLEVALHNSKFKLPAGNAHIVTVYPLSFSEFTRIFDLYDVFTSIDLFGSSPKEDYNNLRELYNLYCVLGGMPGITISYLSYSGSRNLEDVVADEFEDLISILSNESGKYGYGVYEILKFQELLESACSLMMHESQKSSLEISNEIQKISIKDNRMTLRKSDISQLLSYFIGSKVVLPIPKFIDCSPSNKIYNQRLYFNDVGLFNYVASNMNFPKSSIIDKLNENYVCNVLKRKKIKNFGYGYISGTDSEIDFCYGLGVSNQVVGLEVKTGSMSGNSVKTALSKGYIKKIVYCKGDTFGGKTDKIDTIPIYLLERYDFLNCTGLSHEESKFGFKEINAFSKFNKRRR